MRLYGLINLRAFSSGIIDRTGAQTMLYLTCTTITRVDFAHCGVSRAKTGFLWIVVQSVPRILRSGKIVVKSGLINDDARAIDVDIALFFRCAYPTLLQSFG